MVKAKKIKKKQSSMMVFSFISFHYLICFLCLPGTWILILTLSMDFIMKISVFKHGAMAFLQYFGLHSSALLLGFILKVKYPNNWLFLEL